MHSQTISFQPTLRQLLKLEALSEAQVVCGEEFLDKQVTQVVSGLYSGQRPGTLAVVKIDSLIKKEVPDLLSLAGIVLVKPFIPSSSGNKSSSLRTQTTLDLDCQFVLAACQKSSIPLILLPSLGGVEVAEEIRAAYLSEVRKVSAYTHNYFVRLVIEEGLGGLIDKLSYFVGRPCVVETSKFKVLASHNMGATPVGQQKTLTDKVAGELNRQVRLQGKENEVDAACEPVGLGRRLVSPILLEGVVVGYLSVMVRASDDLNVITEYLRPATLAALVDFSQRRREFSASTVTHKSLLKDLLAGQTLSASDQERVERYYGFDICDGLLVFAVKILPATIANNLVWEDERLAVVEMEGAYVFVIPYDGKQEKPWQYYANNVQASIKKKAEKITIQLGAGRLAQTSLDLPDTYSEARQALVLGSLIYNDQDFVISYGDLGIKRILYLIIDHPEVERFYTENLLPLEVYDKQWDTDLMPTLRVYLEQGYNLNSAAKELFIHRHTMRYRLEQIAELLRIDIDNPEVLLNLQIAFQIRDMKKGNQIFSRMTAIAKTSREEL